MRIDALLLPPAPIAERNGSCDRAAYQRCDGNGIAKCSVGEHLAMVTVVFKTRVSWPAGRIRFGLFAIGFERNAVDRAGPLRCSRSSRRSQSGDRLRPTVRSQSAGPPIVWRAAV
jgi:hypothetical protein